MATMDLGTIRLHRRALLKLAQLYRSDVELEVPGDLVVLRKPPQFAHGHDAIVVVEVPDPLDVEPLETADFVRVELHGRRTWLPHGKAEIIVYGVNSAAGVQRLHQSYVDVYRANRNGNLVDPANNAAFIAAYLWGQP